MKYLIVASLLLVVLLLVYLRIKPYLSLARRVLRAFRNVQEVHRQQFGAQPRRSPARGFSERLVRCHTCRVLLPASRAIALQRSPEAVYCSRDCLQKDEGGRSSTKDEVGRMKDESVIS